MSPFRIVLLRLCYAGSCAVLLLLPAAPAAAQSRFAFPTTLEAGALPYLGRTVTVDPGPGWRGYYLPRDAGTGVQVRLIQSVRFREWLRAGAAVSYARYGGYNGVLLAADLQVALPRRLSPFLYLSPGYSRFWNQYEGGTGTMMTDAGAGISYRLKGRYRVSLSAGLMLLQQSAFVPVRLGISR